MIRLWLPVAAYMAFLFLLSGQSGLPGVGYSWDKLLHVVAYCGLGLVCLRAFNAGLRVIKRRPTLLAMLTTIGYGLLDELRQSRVPGRDASLGDWLADVVGAALSLALVGLSVFIRSKGTGARTLGQGS